MIISTEPTRVVITFGYVNLNLHCEMERVYLQQSGGKVANQIGDGEHEESDGQEDAGANTDEIRVSCSKIKFIAL